MPEKLGLLPTHHGELNKVGVPADRVAQLRELYADDPVALFEIDMYDITTEIGRNAYAYCNAVVTGDHQTAEKLGSWLDSHNPKNKQ